MYFSKNVLLQLENLAINDVLTLKVARRDAIANLKCFGAETASRLFGLLCRQCLQRGPKK